MDMNIEGCLRQCADYPIDFIRHRGRLLTDSEARTILNYGKAKEYKTIFEIPDEVADAVCSIGNEEYKDYEPNPDLRFVSVQRVCELLKCWDGTELTNEVINQIIEEL